MTTNHANRPDLAAADELRVNHAATWRCANLTTRLWCALPSPSPGFADGVRGRFVHVNMRARLHRGDRRQRVPVVGVATMTIPFLLASSRKSRDFRGWSLVSFVTLSTVGSSCRRSTSQTPTIRTAGHGLPMMLRPTSRTDERGAICGWSCRPCGRGCKLKRARPQRACHGERWRRFMERRADDPIALTQPAVSTG